MRGAGGSSGFGAFDAPLNCETLTRWAHRSALASACVGRSLAREAKITFHLGYPTSLDGGRLHAQLFRHASLQLFVGRD